MHLDQNKELIKSCVTIIIRIKDKIFLQKQSITPFWHASRTQNNKEELLKKKKTEDQYRNTTSEVELVTSKDDEFVVIFSSPLFLSNLLKDDQLAFLTVNGRQRQQVVVDTENERTNERTNKRTNEQTLLPIFFSKKMF